MPRAHQLLAAYVLKSANRISAAKLVYVDGAASSSDFPLSNAETFVPGKPIEILAGPGDDAESLFEGIVIRQSVKVREHSGPQLIIECRHVAAKLTGARKSAYYFDQTDADIATALLENARIDADVASTSVTHKQQVQFDCTDWDFLLTRAEANGLLVFTNGAGVTIKKPELAEPKCTLQFGATILELDATADARLQPAAVRSVLWDAGQQEVLEKEANEPAMAGPGNFAPDDLADVLGQPHLSLRHTPATEEEAQAWADAQWLKSRLSKTAGRAKCEGLSTVNPGDTVTLAGVGERFSGDVYITGVRHDFDLVQGWKTHLQFGGTETWLAQQPDVSAPRAAALLPAVSGLQIGVVVSNEDPAGEHRVRVRMPLVSGDADGAWARVASLDAGEERGFFFRPEIGDEVVLGFLNDDPRHAVILGMLHSSAKAPPLQGSDDNHEKMLQTRSGMKVHFDDDKKVLTLETPAGNTLVLSEADKLLRLADQNGNKIELTTDGVIIESSKAIELKAGTEVNLESGTAFSAKGGTQLKLEGMSGAELSSTATTKVKGSLLQLN